MFALGHGLAALVQQFDRFGDDASVGLGGLPFGGDCPLNVQSIADQNRRAEPPGPLQACKGGLLEDPDPRLESLGKGKPEKAVSDAGSEYCTLFSVRKSSPISKSSK
jgi:hypothetical protein